MKLTTPQMLVKQASSLRACVVIFGLALALTVVYAQEGKPVVEDATSAKGLTDTEGPADAVKPAKADPESAELGKVELPLEPGPSLDPDANAGVQDADQPTEPELKLISNRLFHVKLNPEQQKIRREGRELVWLEIDPLCREASQVKPGHSVDLSVADLEQFAILESGETYRPKYRDIDSHVPVERVYPSVHADGELVGVRLGVLATPSLAEDLRRESAADGGSWLKITHLVRLKHCRAEDAVKVLEIAFPGGKCSADATQNAVVLSWALRNSIGELAKVEAAIRKLDVPSSGATVIATTLRTVLDTPATKPLIEQLQEQESAAAAEAAAIRQLQANGSAKQNQQPISEHQRKLRDLLSTAFDLKLQLEELQMKELQSRLEGLERQIGQRKELREKIIDRRATELIHGDPLKWSPTAPPVARTTEIGAKDRGSPTTIPPAFGLTRETKVEVPPPTGKDENVVVDLYGGSKVLGGMSKLPKYSKLVKSLNALAGVTTNFREAYVDDASTIIMAIVRDPSQRCQLESRRTNKESELKITINTALKEAGVAVRWDEVYGKIELPQAGASTLPIEAPQPAPRLSR